MYGKTTLILRSALVMGLLSFMHLSQAQATTVCSMTLNSTDELEVVKKSLGTKDYSYVELGSDLQGACNKGIRCDVLVVSGHFGGEFFGDKGEVSLEALERLSCSRECGQLFGQAKQVFLFGCNTLNGKVADRRTPEQYVQVLRDDHYKLSHAQRMAANIYSPFGGTYFERMQYVFPNTPNIYGFHAVAPSGKNIRKPLERAFLPWASSYKDTLLSDSAADRWTQALAKELSRFPFTSTSGKPLSESLSCQIFSQGSELKKLKIIRELFENGQGLKVAPLAIEYFRKLTLSSLDFREEKELKKLIANKTVRDQLLAFIMTSSDSFAIVRLELLRMMAKIEWISPSEAFQIANEITHRVLAKQSYNLDYLQVLGAAKDLGAPDFKTFPNEVWSKREIYAIADFFMTKDKYVVARILETLRSTQDARVAEAAAKTLIKIEKFINIESDFRAAANLLLRFDHPNLKRLSREMEDIIRNQGYR